MKAPSPETIIRVIKDKIDQKLIEQVNKESSNKTKIIRQDAEHIKNHQVEVKRELGFLQK